MRGRAIIPLVVGLLVGVLAIKIFADVLRKARSASGANDAISVVYANCDIPATSEITGAMVATQKIPRPLAPKLTFADINELSGRVASVGIPKGMPIVPSHLAPKGTPPGMSARIKEGYRAVSVKVDESSGVAGWLKPGCRVDVAAVMQVEGSSSQRKTMSKVILENLEVLAVGQDNGTTGDVNASVTKSVTLAVAPEDVPKLHLATTQGTVRLAMRNQYDVSTADSHTTDKELLGIPAEPAPARPTASSGLASAILGRLLEKQPKMAASKTDKDHKASPVAPPELAKAAMPIRVEAWQVEVLTGQQREEVWFDAKTNDARRLDAKTDGRSQGIGAAMFEKYKPASTGVPVAEAHSGPSMSFRPTESRE